MNLFISIFIFCIILFFYLHIYFHLNTSNDLEIYEIELPSKDKFEEICDLKQPVLFSFQNERLLETCNRAAILDTYGAFDIKLRNVKNSAINTNAAAAAANKKEATEKEEEEVYVPLPFSSAIQVLANDTEMKYISENNMEFLEETSLIKTYKYNDAFFRPYMVSNCIYDFITAATGTQTPLRYELNYRNFFYVTEGEVKIKLTPPKSSRYLYQITDYENMEFYSPINPWHVQASYKNDFDKIKCLELTLQKGQMLFMPAFWWYSIEFGKNASICSMKYRTYMNNVAILDKILMKFLQSQNTKRTLVKTYTPI